MDAHPGIELIDGAGILNDLRLIKTPAEIACLRRAGALACTAYREFMRYAVPGNSELQAAGAAEGAARMAGAEVLMLLNTGREEVEAKIDIYFENRDRSGILP